MNTRNFWRLIGAASLFALMTIHLIAQGEIPAGPQPTATVTPLQSTPAPTATVTPLPSASPSGTQPQTTNTATPSPSPTPEP